MVATVIAAAVIGDLLFDFSGRNEARGRTTVAVLCALSLLVVVVSVLMFGLVTLDNQNRGDAVQLAQHNVAVHVEQSAQMTNQGSVLVQQSSNRLSAARARYEAELTGAGGSSHGPTAAAARQQVSLLEKQSASARKQAAALSRLATARRVQADRLLENSLTNLSIGRKQAAIMSVIMFLLSWLTGAVALWISTDQDKGRQSDELLGPEAGH